MNRNIDLTRTRYFSYRTNKFRSVFIEILKLPDFKDL